MRVDCTASAQSELAAPPSVQQFCEITTPYLPETDSEAAFITAMRDITRWHQQRSPWYARLLAQHQVDVDALTTLESLIALPPVHANFFKQHEILSVPEDAITLHLTSSGTTGQKSQMFFDAFTIGHGRRMADDCMQARGMVSSAPAHYLVNAYEPYDGLRVGTSNTNQYLMRYAPAAEVFWTLRALGQGQHEFDAFGAVARLQRWAEGSTPVRIIGFPAFLHFTLQRLEKMGIAPLQLAPGSAVILGGGWKGHADQAIAKEAMHASITRQLGIASERIVETFGSVEHSIPYTSCSHHHLHQPTWSRVLVRDVATLRPLAHGQAGFLSFLSPYITSVPAHSVVMGDLGVLHAASSCACGTPTPWFEILGRAGTSSNKSCAAAAAELLPSG
ncbi:acyl-protein synthase [Comamonas sp. NLF-1-9]|uniref:LuxE/PaaK family acyltransferase n=1 Tax=Comamonas sp. NLF-1-9 TaxID=2853163 RepID=UPI001C4956BF|nr:acyl-protein synthase [Comamonas sp. NLF-1-9]QXL85419.1 acyl-protein synthase [Comamonas sp. NLF-1-9]